MNLDKRPSLEVHNEPKHHILEIINAEKQLWSLIYLKGLFHNDARDLYINICSRYENIILGEREEIEFQEIEYSLWKLHYKHIHEFRKRIDQSSTSTGCTESEINNHVEKFNSFLTEATEFYQNLILKIKNFYGLGELEGFSFDHMKLRKWQFSCHRFLVCLGDLARYRELCKKIDIQRHNWSVAASYYFKAASSWPDSGNPQNQLAVLAKYIGDDFLALYHCVRSLAVKEPFPDARNNLILLLEENRSLHLESLSREAKFNFLNPSKKSVSPIKSSPSERDVKNKEMQATDCTSKSAFWSLFIRFVSLFLIESSSEEFDYTFASTMRELELFLELDDIKLSAALESYQQLDSDKTGPYRTLQLVSLIIFVVDSLATRFDHIEAKEKTILKQPNQIKSALTATFIILGRLTERCLEGNSVKSSTLLPPVLIFVEWLVGILDIIQKYTFEGKNICAVSNFLDTFVELLNKIETGDAFKDQKDNALWEDYELRGFAPMAHSHGPLNFRTHEEHAGEFLGENTRIRRIFNAAIKIVNKSPNGFRKWIFYDIEREKFFTTEQPSLIDLDLAHPQETICESIKEKEKIAKFVIMEEEEEIVFKPLARYNSAPIYSPEKETSTEGIKDKTVTSHDSLRRATSLFARQIQNLNSDSKKHETVLKANVTPYPAGPPSLNAWVLDNARLEREKEKASMDFFKPRLSPIEEIGSLSLIDSPLYLTPIPSAPLLPDDALLFCENSVKHKINYFDNPLVSPISSSNIYTGVPVFERPLGFTPMSSSEWLHQFRNQNLNRGNLYGQLDLVANGVRTDDFSHNHQRLCPYGCGGGVAGIKAESSLLQYLKEKEWKLQNQAQVRGPAYMGN